MMFETLDLDIFDRTEIQSIISAIGETVIMLGEEIHEARTSLTELQRKHEVLTEAMNSIKCAVNL